MAVLDLLAVLLLRGLFSSLASGSHSSRGAWASHWGGFSCCGSWALDHKLNSCETWAYLLSGMWDLPRSGIEPMSPVLAGGFFTTEPTGKPLYLSSYCRILYVRE